MSFLSTCIFYPQLHTKRDSKDGFWIEHKELQNPSGSVNRSVTKKIPFIASGCLLALSVLRKNARGASLAVRAVGKKIPSNQYRHIHQLHGTISEIAKIESKELQYQKDAENELHAFYNPSEWKDPISFSVPIAFDEMNCKFQEGCRRIKDLKIKLQTPEPSKISQLIQDAREKKASEDRLHEFFQGDLQISDPFKHITDHIPTSHHTASIMRTVAKRTLKATMIGIGTIAAPVVAVSLGRPIWNRIQWPNPTHLKGRTLLERCSRMERKDIYHFSMQTAAMGGASLLMIKNIPETIGRQALRAGVLSLMMRYPEALEQINLGTAIALKWFFPKITGYLAEKGVSDQFLPAFIGFAGLSSEKALAKLEEYAFGPIIKSWFPDLSEVEIFEKLIEPIVFSGVMIAIWNHPRWILQPVTSTVIPFVKNIFMFECAKESHSNMNIFFTNGISSQVQLFWKNFVPSLRQTVEACKQCIDQFFHGIRFSIDKEDINYSNSQDLSPHIYFESDSSDDAYDVIKNLSESAKSSVYFYANRLLNLALRI